MRTILVTGGNKGIGKAVCQMLLEKYSDVFVWMGSRDISRGQTAINDIIKSVSNAKDRVSVVSLDVSNIDSIHQALETIKKDTKELYAIINNAGIGFDHTVEETVQINYFGPRNVNETFIPLLKKDGGRIINVASASGPMFVSSCSDVTLKQQFTEPWTITNGISELDTIAKNKSTCTSTGKDFNSYGFSKALLNAYTWLLARDYPTLTINSVTPGFIDTDITKGMGASKPPSAGAVPIVKLAMDDDIAKLPTGRFYGSDCVRSPWHEYRDPGTPPYNGPDGK